MTSSCHNTTSRMMSPYRHYYWLFQITWKSVSVRKREKVYFPQNYRHFHTCNCQWILIGGLPEGLSPITAGHLLLMTNKNNKIYPTKYTNKYKKRKQVCLSWTCPWHNRLVWYFFRHDESHKFLRYNQGIFRDFGHGVCEPTFGGPISFPSSSPLPPSLH